MTRYILKNRIESVEQLKTFAWEGFEFNEQLSVRDKICIYKRKNRMNRDDRNEKMRSGELADMSAPELQVRFEHAKSYWHECGA